MDWIKLPIDSILYSEFKNSELIVLIKYQALYCQLEKEPSDAQLNRVFNKKELKLIQSYAEVVQELCQSQIVLVNKKRNRDKENYKQKQSLGENSASGPSTDRQRSGVADKNREDKNREDNIYITETSKLGDEMSNDIKRISSRLKEILVNYYSRDFNSASWGVVIKKMIKNDKLSVDDIMEKLDWYEKNIGGTYTPVIQSASSLREKYCKLEDAIIREKNNTIKSNWNKTKEDDDERCWF